MKPDITLVGHGGKLVIRDDEYHEVTVWQVTPGLVELDAVSSLRVRDVDVFGPALVEIRRPR